MPVYICCGPTTKLEKAEIWSLGQRWPAGIDVDRVTAFAADGEELELTLAHAKNLPHTDHWLQVRYVDTAKFLFRAMPGLTGVICPRPLERGREGPLAKAGNR